MIFSGWWQTQSLNQLLLRTPGVKGEKTLDLEERGVRVGTSVCVSMRESERASKSKKTENPASTTGASDWCTGQ